MPKGKGYGSKSDKKMSPRKQMASGLKKPYGKTAKLHKSGRKK